MSIATDLQTIAENTPKVYEAGKDAESKSFWGVLLNYGNPKRYAYAFYGWNRDIFYPRYNIVCNSNMASLFHFFEQNATKGFDLSARLKECGVVLDTSGATTGGAYTFYWTSFTKIPTVDLTGIIDTEKLTYTFARNYLLEEIEKITVKETNVFNVTFDSCIKLKKIKFDGVIGTTIDFRVCPLDKDSIISVVTHLSDNVEEQTLYLKKTAVVNAFGSEDAPEWIELITPKSNQYNGKWTISLI